MERGFLRVECLALPRIEVERQGHLVLAPRFNLHVSRVRAIRRMMEPTLVGDRGHANDLKSRVRHLRLRAGLIRPDRRPPSLRCNPSHEGRFDCRVDHDDTLAAIAFVYPAIAWKSLIACTS